MVYCCYTNTTNIHQNSAWDIVYRHCAVCRCCSGCCRPKRSHCVSWWRRVDLHIFSIVHSCAMIKTWIASRLKLPRSEVGGWCLPIEPWSSHMDLWPRSWSTFVHLRPFALATNGFRVSWRIWPWSRWVSYLLSWHAVLTLAIPWWEMEFCRLAWHMDAAHLISPIDTCWRSPLISGLVQLI